MYRTVYIFGAHKDFLFLELYYIKKEPEGKENSKTKTVSQSAILASTNFEVEKKKKYRLSFKINKVWMRNSKDEMVDFYSFHGPLKCLHS